MHMSDIDKDGLPEQFEIEIVDLDQIEDQNSARGNGPSHALRHLILFWQRTEQRRLRRRVTQLLLVVLASGLLLALLSPSTGLSALVAAHWPFQGPSASSVPPDPSMAQNLQSGGQDIICPVQTAWSPDGAQIALLGYTQACNQEGSYRSAQIDLYDAATAHLTGHLRPDDMILTAAQQSIDPALRATLARKPETSGDTSLPAIDYQQILWSPDNTHLALSFTITMRLASYAGLFLLAHDGTQGRLFLYLETVPTNVHQVPSLLWDLQAGHATLLSGLTPALTYVWGADDTLQPDGLLNSRQAPTAYMRIPVGNPDGGRAFSIWQPGNALVLSLMHEPSAYLWSASFAAWSPDSRYLITHFSFAGLMEPPGQTFPTASALQAMDVAAVPWLPSHDAALIPSSSSARVEAWNPQGTLLAVYDLNGLIDLYDCQTGQFLRSLSTHTAGALPDFAPLLNWSPDGRSLLLSSTQGGLFSLWSAASLTF